MIHQKKLAKNWEVKEEKTAHLLLITPPISYFYHRN
jgi:hypothetical protein